MMEPSISGAVLSRYGNRTVCVPMKLSVVIPVFNEASTITQLIDRVRAVDLDKEIIVVDDCSSDGTGDVLRRLPPSPDLVLHYHPVNRGKGAALRTGFAAATGD